MFEQIELRNHGIKVYLDHMINVQSKQLADSHLPMLVSEADLDNLETFLEKKLIPEATKMIEREVSIGVPCGRIVEVFGPELRFVISLELTNRFINEHLGQCILREYMAKEDKDNKDTPIYYLRTVELMCKVTKQFFFIKLEKVFVDNQLEPLIERLDQSFRELFQV